MRAVIAVSVVVVVVGGYVNGANKCDCRGESRDSSGAYRLYLCAPLSFSLIMLMLQGYVSGRM